MTFSSPGRAAPRLALAALLVALLLVPTASAQSDAPLAVLNPHVDPTDLKLGGDVQVTATVDNPQNRTVNATVLLYVNDVDVDGFTLQMGPFEMKPVGFVYHPPTAGVYHIHIGNSFPTTVTVHDTSNLVPGPGAGAVGLLLALAALLRRRARPPAGGEP